MKIYGFTYVNSEGFCDARETRTYLFASKEKMIDGAYKHYKDAIEYFDSEGEELEFDDNPISEYEFKQEIENLGYEVADYGSFHCQWEAFEQEI